MLNKTIPYYLLSICLILVTLEGFLLLSAPLPNKGTLFTPFRAMQFKATYVTGVFLNRLCHFGRATTFLSKAREIAPQHDQIIEETLNRAIHNAALHHYVHSNYKESLRLIQSTVRYQEKAGLEELLLIGMCLWYLDDASGVVKTARIALKLEPANTHARLLEFRGQLAMNGLQAYHELQKQQVQYFADSEILITIGDLLWNSGHYDVAGDLYEQGLDRFPTMAAFHYRLAVYNHRIKGDRDQAQKDIEQVIALDYTYPGARQEYDLILNHSDWPRGKAPGLFPQKAGPVHLQGMPQQSLGIIFDKRRPLMDEHLQP